MDTVAETHNSSSKEEWVAVTTKKVRKSIPMGCYDPASGMTVKWNVTAIDVDLDIDTVLQTGYLWIKMRSFLHRCITFCALRLPMVVQAWAAGL